MFMKQRMLIGLCVSFICLSPQLMAEKRAQKVIVKKSDIVKKTIGIKVNAISILIPCHRILGSNGDIVGYAGDLPTKKKLLDLEKNVFVEVS